MSDNLLESLLSKAAADPGIRHEAIKSANRLARKFVSLLAATDALAEAADLDAAFRHQQARVDQLRTEADGILTRAQAEADAALRDAQAEVATLKAEAADLRTRVTAAQGREKTLNTSIAALEQSLLTAQARLDALTQREAELCPIVEAAEQAEGRLAAAQAGLAEIEAKRAELLKSLGVQ